MSQELRLIRRITLKLIPFLILLYLIAYVDRSAVGFAKLNIVAEVVIV
ncbi:MFS transporter, partial [Pseudomonas sp. NPDC078863]